ncbi:hypothetical protein CDD82_7991 [Ophiocordyceps australis]|uniref:glycogenin glucosyltransferase n=1 Tax=Ophiocordyceps australis TaxID=1399860 RepID=A0A2C5YHW0_9HYPO|nr:hypothetical protein CDD82_7991 [Ophiocordyceps australis]
MDIDTQVYATLLLDDSYLPGALVLAHSLRDAQSAKELAVLVTLDSVSVPAINQLKTLYRYVVPVPRLCTGQPTNLYLMDRPDLHSAFTKIYLWKQTQFTKVVYIDADVIAYRAPDELFSTTHAFSAAPDIGWPDIFNTGVMVLTPNMGDFYALLNMAQRAISFDGADQGLLNMHFGTSFNRLPYIYNVTPSAHYQYLPAYRHFQSNIVMVHFIGPIKPWFRDRNTSYGNSALDEMTGRWWAVHDRHYRTQETILDQPPSPQHQVCKSSVSLELNPSSDLDKHAGYAHVANKTLEYPCSSAPQHPPSTCSIDTTSQKQPSTTVAKLSQKHDTAQASRSNEFVQQPLESPPALPMSAWDPQRHPPPPLSKPEAVNFPSTHYHMSADMTPFTPPDRYPSPPRSVGYHVPKGASRSGAHAPWPIFPWEKNQPRPARSFINERLQSAPTVVHVASTISNTSLQPTDDKSEEQPSSTPTTNRTLPSDSWISFSRVNAWDESPEIACFMKTSQYRQRGRNKGAEGNMASSPNLENRSQRKTEAQGLRLTDFPSQVERPSLPVTPAPIRRPLCWPETHDRLKPGNSGGAPLPAAQGVPPQPEWDPAEQLDKLARLQSEALVQKLGRESDRQRRQATSESLPLGSEAVRLEERQTGPAQLNTLCLQDSSKTSALTMDDGMEAKNELVPETAIALHDPSSESLQTILTGKDA